MMSKMRRGRTLTITWRRWREGWRVFAGNRLALLGFWLIAWFAFLSAVYPLLRATVWAYDIYDPITGYDRDIFQHPSPPSWLRPEQLAADDPHRYDLNRPSYDHLLGTDTLGRDVLSVLLASTGPSFIVGLSAALTTAGVGLAIATVSAYYRGPADGLLTHLSNAFLLLPPPILMIAIGS
ncbi:MAG: hypothetical protein AB1791_23445, partial [Chloroflexota bacterium]